MNKIITFEPVLKYKEVGFCIYCNILSIGKKYPSRRLRQDIFVCNDCMFKSWKSDKLIKKGDKLNGIV